MTSAISASDKLFISILNSLTDHICVVDDAGVIQWVNDAWAEFSRSNLGADGATGLGAGYLDVCGASAEEGDSDAAAVQLGIDEIIDGAKSEFYFEYPCHSPDEQRWFMMRVTRLGSSTPLRLVVSHQNITDRRIAELRSEELALQDGLTGLANRRNFDLTVLSELRRARRHHHSLSLLLLDIDSFKAVNDRDGHLVGDAILRAVADTLSGLARRPGDQAARFGGDEFALILADTNRDDAVAIAESIRSDVRDRTLSDGNLPQVTVSLGVATVEPSVNDVSVPSLIAEADRALYRAKADGRDRVAVGEPVAEDPLA